MQRRRCLLTLQVQDERIWATYPILAAKSVYHNQGYFFDVAEVSLVCPFCFSLFIWWINSDISGSHSGNSCLENLQCRARVSICSEVRVAPLHFHWLAERLNKMGGFFPLLEGLFIQSEPGCLFL